MGVEYSNTFVDMLVDDGRKLTVTIEYRKLTYSDKWYFDIRIRHGINTVFNTYLDPADYHEFCSMFNVASLGADMECQQWMNDQAEKQEGSEQRV
jgi:hypothetical protein